MSLRCTHPTSCLAGRSAVRGLGLVELLVALVLGLIVVGAASVLFISTRQNNRATDSLSRMQDSVRGGFDMFMREVREAGGTPCDSQLRVSNVLLNAQGGSPTWWAVWTDPVFGYGSGDVFSGAIVGADATQRVSGTDALLVRYAPALGDITVSSHNTTTATFTLSKAQHGLRAGDVLMVCNYRQAAVTQVVSVDTTAGTFLHDTTAGTPGNCSNGLGIPVLCTATGTTFEFGSGSRLGRYTAVGWYVGNNGRTTGGGRSLYRVTRTGPEEVAEGVRDMQLSYLLTGASSYVGASSVGAANWGNVLAVRVDLTVESDENRVGTTETAKRITRSVSFTANLRNLQP
jgi:type IV pilus assembly protein PilW